MELELTVPPECAWAVSVYSWRSVVKSDQLLFLGEIRLKIKVIPLFLK